MNKMLERAIAEAATLPEDRQETLAYLMLEEIEAERRQDRRGTTLPGALSTLVEQARARIAAGETLPFDPSNRPKT